MNKLLKLLGSFTLLFSSNVFDSNGTEDKSFDDLTVQDMLFKIFDSNPSNYMDEKTKKEYDKINNELQLPSSVANVKVYNDYPQSLVGGNDEADEAYTKKYLEYIYAESKTACDTYEKLKNDDLWAYCVQLCKANHNFAQFFSNNQITKTYVRKNKNALMLRIYLVNDTDFFTNVLKINVHKPEKKLDSKLVDAWFWKYSDDPTVTNELCALKLRFLPPSVSLMLGQALGKFGPFASTKELWDFINPAGCLDNAAKVKYGEAFLSLIAMGMELAKEGK